jgi:glycerophosphoryl diester phosphodiesterase
VALNVWTVNGPGDLAAMRNLGVDTVITDDVPLALGIIDT